MLGVDLLLLCVDLTISRGNDVKQVVGHVTDDGQIVEGAVLGMFFPKRQNGFRGGWVAMAQPALMALAKSNLGQQDWRVLAAVLARLDFENYILLNQAEIASELGMHRPDVSKALKHLEQLGVLLRGPKAGRSSTFRLDPSFGWKGSATNHQKALKKRMEAVGLSVVKIDQCSDSESRAELEALGQQRLMD